jgi:phosphatidylglycerol lysyltransferase
MKRRWLIWLLVIGFVWVAASRYAELRNFSQTLATGQWQWVAVAALIQIVYFVVFSASYQAAFSAVEVKSRVRELVPVTLGSLFINTVAPTAGMAGAALFVDDAARRGESPARAAAGTLLQLTLDYLAFAVILLGGLVYLFIQHDLKGYEVAAAVFLLSLTFLLSGVLVLGLWKPPLVGRLLGWLQRTANALARRLRSRDFFVEDWAARNAAEFTSAASAIGGHPRRIWRTFAIAFAAHGLDIASLYALFLAFSGPVQFGTLIAGYVVAILLWIASPTPQGVGVVEGVMPLVFISLGVPAGPATAVSLAFRGLTYWLPLLLGFILIRRTRTFGTSERSLAYSWNVRILALAVALMGVINVLSAVTPALANRAAVLARISPLEVRHGGHLTAALGGFALILLAGGLWRRKRVAWLLALTILCLSIASHLVKGLDYEEALLAAGLSIWLVAVRHEFHARSDQPSIQQGLIALLVALGFTLAYGALGFYLLDRQYSVNFGLLPALRQTVIMFTQFYDPGLQPLTGFGRYFADSIYVVGVVTFSYAFFMLLRPVFLRQPATPQERRHAQEIVEAYGRSSLARLVLMDDKAYYFSPGGSLVAFALRNSIAAALGDPIGPPGDLNNTIRGFTSYCSRNDWRPAFYQTLADSLPAYQAAGFEAVCIGQEAIVDLAAFTIERSANKALRNPFNRLAKAGFQIEIHQPPIGRDLLDDLRRISDEWLTMVRGTEKRFSLGWFDDDYIRSCPVITVCNPQGVITAFANIVKEYQLNEITIDLMRRRRESEPGTMEFLFVSLFFWARQQGYATFNLGLSALAYVGESPGDPALDRALHFIYEHISRFYNFKGLHDFKEKFHPRWSPRYLIYSGAANLMATWIAVTRADGGK